MINVIIIKVIITEINVIIFGTLGISAKTTMFLAREINFKDFFLCSWFMSKSIYICIFLCVLEKFKGL